MLASERLILNLLEPADVKDVHELLSYAEVDKYNTLGIPGNMSETQEILKAHVIDNTQASIRKYTFKIVERSSGDFVGLIALNLDQEKYSSAETWYKLLPAKWNRGFASEALHEILHFGFAKLKLHRIVAGCSDQNVASIKVLEKVGMALEGRRRKALPLKSGWSDTCEFAILSEDFG